MTVAAAQLLVQTVTIYVGIGAAFAAVFVWQWVEETKGKHLEDMHREAWHHETHPAPH